MTAVRVLVGRKKGAFILTSDGTRSDWTVAGPHFAGWEVYHMKGSPADPDRIFASQTSAWFGQIIQRSSDGGKTWEQPGSMNAASSDSTESDDAPSMPQGESNKFVYDTNRIYTAMSAAGAFRTDDGGDSWKPINNGLHSQYIPDPTAEIGHCVHRLAMHPANPDTLFMQKHWDVMRSDDAGENWTEIGGNLPTDFGFPIDVHTHEPETIYVVPIKSDSEHYPPGGKLRVYRSRTGG